MSERDAVLGAISAALSASVPMRTIMPNASVDRPLRFASLRPGSAPALGLHQSSRRGPSGGDYLGSARRAA